MSTNFEECIAKITSSASILNDLDERAVELGVVLPLLRCAGWDTEDLTQIYPQKPVSESRRDKVDYDLQIDGASRVFLEVKRWRYDLGNAEEDQLRDYCLEGKPSLAVLTNGRHWRLYLPPLKPKSGKNSDLRQFLGLDITREPLEVVKEKFKRFLSYDNVQFIRATRNAALKLHKERIGDATVRENLRNALTELATDKQKQKEALEVLAEHLGISANEAQLEQFLNSSGNLINVVDDGSNGVQKTVPKPRSFTLSAAGVTEPVAVKHWNELKHAICNLMCQRHPDGFKGKLLGMNGNWFSGSPERGDQIGDTGVYVKGGGSTAIRQLCHDIVASFGYPEGSLTIKEKRN